MLRKLVKIEEAEFRYFITIKTLMLNRIGEILNLLNSRIDIIRIDIIFLGLQGKDTNKATLIWEQREFFIIGLQHCSKFPIQHL
ncbi:MAG: hypothetical protein ACO2OT_06355 [Candidatus Caldipriscus sp.]|jgi:hypothetical protein